MRIQSPNWIQSIYHKCSVFLDRPNPRCFYSSEEELLDIAPRWTAIAKWAVNEPTPPKEHEDAVTKLKKTLVIKEYLRRQTWSMPFSPVYWTGQYCEYLGMETSNTRHPKRSIWELDSSPVAPTVNICLQCGRSGFDPWVRKSLWRRKWQPIPVLLPRKSQGWKSLAGYSPWGRKETDTTERLHLTLTLPYIIVV